MAVFACSRCQRILTPTLRYGPPQDSPGGDPSVNEGSYFVDPNPASRTYDGRTGELTKEDARNCVVMHPMDLVTVVWADREGRWSGCCGPDGGDGMNLLCANCGAPIGTLSADCWKPWEIRIEPTSVVSVSGSDVPEMPGTGRPPWHHELQGDPFRLEDAPDDGNVEVYEQDDEDGDVDPFSNRLSIWNICLGAGKVWAAASNAPLVVVIDQVTSEIDTVIELSNAAEGTSRPLPRWGIADIAFGAGTVWVTDVVEPGLFAIDVTTQRVRGRVPLMTTDERTPESSPAGQVAASESLVASTGHGQGDIALIDANDLRVGKTLRGGRSLQGLAVTNRSIWVGDDADDTVRRIDVDSGETIVFGLDGRPDQIEVIGDRAWVSSDSPTIPMMGRLVALSDHTGEPERRIQTAESGSMCLSGDSLWLATSSMDDFAGGEEDDEDDDEDDEIRSDLMDLDPETLAIRRSNPIRGQVFDLVGNEVGLWASVFSRADQVDRILRIDPTTAALDRLIEFNSIDVSPYNPVDPEPEVLEPSNFAGLVQTMLRSLAGEPLSGSVRVRAEGRSIRTTVSSQGPSTEWSGEFELATGQATEGFAERVSETLLATYLAQWDVATPAP